MGGPSPIRTNWPVEPIGYRPPSDEPNALKEALEELRAYRDRQEQREALARHQDILDAHDARQARIAQYAELAAELTACAEAGVFDEPEAPVGPVLSMEEQLAEALRAFLNPEPTV